PELASGTISPVADVWSLGITLIQALTQFPPLWDRTKRRDPIVPESIPQPFADIARGCLRSDPARRYTLSEVKARLGSARSLRDPASKAGRTANGKLGVTALIGGALILFGVIATLQLRSHRTQQSLPTGVEPSTPALAALPSQSPTPEAQTFTGVAVKGAVAERVLPDVLPSAMESIQGKVDVSVRVTVNPRGEVSDAALDSPGPSKYFAKVA